MTLHIGELTSHVEIAPAAAPPSVAGSGRPADGEPHWTERDRHRRIAEAGARDTARTTPGERYA